MQETKEKLSKLDDLPRATEVKEQITYEVTTLDGKKYLCELIAQDGCSQEGFRAHHYNERDKRLTFWRINNFLTENNLKADIIQEKEYNRGKRNFMADNSVESEYIVRAYKIKQELSQ